MPGEGTFVCKRSPCITPATCPGTSWAARNLDSAAIAAERNGVGRSQQVAVVVAGYAAAFGAAIVAAHLYNARVAALPYDTSGGMYAAGETMSSLGAFLVVAAAPTLLALWFLRANEKVWNGVAIASLAFAAAGLLAVLSTFVTRSTEHVALALLGLFSLLQLLGMPLWSVAFALLALLAPTRDTRRKLVYALGIELVIGVLALAHWFGRG